MFSSFPWSPKGVWHCLSWNVTSQIKYSGCTWSCGWSISDLQQHVILPGGSCKSKSDSVTCGTPQGTVLSPILFNLYINDLYNIKDFPGSIIGFADDTCLLFNATNWEETVNNAELGLSIINKWLNANSLSLNYNKTKFITFSATITGQPQDLHHLILHSANCNRATTAQTCSCRRINRVHNIRYLGVLIDFRLSWKDHLTMLNNKCRKTIYYFLQIRNFCNMNALKQVYFALAQSLLEYGIIAWGSAPITHLRSLETTQKAILKVLLRKPRDYPSNLLFRETLVLNIRSLHMKSVLLNFYNCQRRQINHRFQTRASSRQNLIAYKCKTSLLQRHASITAVKWFNSLPPEIRNTQPYMKYKKKILMWIRMVQGY